MTSPHTTLPTGSPGVRCLRRPVPGEGSRKDDLVVVAPDAGRVKLNRNFAKRLGAGLALLDKDRPEQGVAEIGAVIGEVSSGELLGNYCRVGVGGLRHGVSRGCELIL